MLVKFIAFTRKVIVFSCLRLAKFAIQSYKHLSIQITVTVQNDNNERVVVVNGISSLHVKKRKNKCREVKILDF